MLLDGVLRGNRRLRERLQVQGALLRIPQADVGREVLLPGLPVRAFSGSETTSQRVLHVPPVAQMSTVDNAVRTDQLSAAMLLVPEGVFAGGEKAACARGTVRMLLHGLLHEGGGGRGGELPLPSSAPLRRRRVLHLLQERLEGRQTARTIPDQRHGRSRLLLPRLLLRVHQSSAPAARGVLHGLASRARNLHDPRGLPLTLLLGAASRLGGGDGSRAGFDEGEDGVWDSWAIGARSSRQCGRDCEQDSWQEQSDVSDVMVKSCWKKRAHC